MTHSPRPSVVTKQIIFDELVRAARAGETCPNNLRLRAVLGATSSATPSRALAQLAADGRIKLFAHSNRREILLVEMDVLLPSNRPSYELTETKRAAEHAAWRAKVEQAEPLPPVVDRDPCFRCGVRGDIGCEHSPAWQGSANTMGAAA